jgi:hypothetical protein
MKKIALFLKRFPITFDIAHSLGAIILTLDVARIINSFEDSTFLDWNIVEQIVFRTIGAFIFGLIISFAWEGEIQEDILKMPASKRDVINMTAFATLTGLFLPYLDFSNTVLIISTISLAIAIFVYLKMYFNSKQK